MTPPFADRDSGEIEAFIIDRYLDSLLSDGRPEAVAVPADLRTTMDRLASDLPRFHPSFRFEERLAVRLAELAVAMRAPWAAGAEGVVIPLPVADARPSLGEAEPASIATARPGARPVVIGGVLTSAALSIAGAAYVAWRRGHPPAEPMARALRAVAKGRLT